MLCGGDERSCADSEDRCKRCDEPHDCLSEAVIEGGPGIRGMKKQRVQIQACSLALYQRQRRGSCGWKARASSRVLHGHAGNSLRHKLLRSLDLLHSVKHFEGQHLDIGLASLCLGTSALWRDNNCQCVTTSEPGLSVNSLRITDTFLTATSGDKLCVYIKAWPS